MEQIQKDTIVANETKEVVSKEEKEAKKKAEESLAIQQDAEKDLAEALPALVSASRNDILCVYDLLLLLLLASFSFLLCLHLCHSHLVVTGCCPGQLEVTEQERCDGGESPPATPHGGETCHRGSLYHEGDQTS